MRARRGRRREEEEEGSRGSRGGCNKMPVKFHIYFFAVYKSCYSLKFIAI